jgi:hypothetical protein
MQRGYVAECFVARFDVHAPLFQGTLKRHAMIVGVQQRGGCRGVSCGHCFVQTLNRLQGR